MIAANGLRNQKVHDGDYVNDEGLLICGTCGERRQGYEMMMPLEPGGERVKTKVVTFCRCEREEEQRKLDEEQRLKDLKKIEELRKASLMDARFAHSTFDRFETDKSNAEILKLCKRYATGFDEMKKKNQGLLMWGGVGTGKSFAAACIANYLLDRKIPVIMTSFVRLLSVIQEKGNVTEIQDSLRHAHLVIFDDLGAERNTSYALEKVYEIVNDRYTAQLPTIYTTNLTLEEMKNEIDTRYNRIYDRIFECCYPMQFTGGSWRKAKAYNRIKEMEKLLKGEEE